MSFQQSKPVSPSQDPTQISTVTVYQHDSSSLCWVNAFIGKNVLVTFPLNSGVVGGAVSLSGTAARIDKFQYRFYLILVQNPGTDNAHEVHINIDHIMTIEEK